MKAALWVANILSWPFIHLVVAKACLMLPDRYFADDGALFAPRSWERGGGFYRRWLAIRSWKGRLPNGAPWLGGFSKKQIVTLDESYLEQFILETRRAEFAHWCMICCLPTFLLWDPPWACGIMAIYAIGANAPCIVAQRYNRTRLSRLKARASNRASETGWAVS